MTSMRIEGKVAKMSDEDLQGEAVKSNFVGRRFIIYGGVLLVDPVTGAAEFVGEPLHIKRVAQGHLRRRNWMILARGLGRRGESAF
jgi:hypothetical protein